MKFAWKNREGLPIIYPTRGVYGSICSVKMEKCIYEKRSKSLKIVDVG